MAASEHLGAFSYVSNRLVSGILAMPEVPAHGRRARIEKLSGELSPTSPKLGMAIGFEDPAFTLQQRAIRATRIVRRLTGGLQNPELPYLRLRLDAYVGTFDVVQGWDWSQRVNDASTQRVFLLASSQVLHSRRTFVGLLGSAQNILIDGVKSSIGPTQGRTPSNIDGLYGLFSQIREHADHTPYADRINHDEGLNELTLARAVMNLAQGSPGDGPPRRIEVLMKRHIRPLTGGVRLDTDGYLAPYDLVLVGAPVWIREVVTAEGALAQPMMDRVGGPEVERFNRARLALADHSQSLVDARVEMDRVTEAMRARLESREFAGPGIRSDLALLSNEELVHHAQATKQSTDRLRQIVSEEEEDLTEVAQSAERWEDFAGWYVSQAALQGIPSVYMSVERAPTWWERVRGIDVRDRAPEQTGVYGVVVTTYEERSADTSGLRSYWGQAHTRSVRFPGSRGGRAHHYLVTKGGDVYPVAVWSFRRIDLRARMVFERRYPLSSSLRVGETPQPNADLVSIVVPAMLEESMRWRVTLKRDVPEVPWLQQGMWERLNPPPQAPMLAIDVEVADMVLDVVADPDLDAETDEERD